MPWLSRPNHWSVPGFFVSVARAASAKRKIDATVAVNVVWLDANVVSSRRTPNDFVFCPAWVFVPDDRILGNDHDVGFPIAIQVGGRDCVADLAGVRVDFLWLESWEVSRTG